MLDLIFVGAAIAFFAIAASYVGACEKLRGAGHD